MTNEIIILIAFIIGSLSIVMMMYSAWKDNRKKPVITWFCIWLMLFAIYFILSPKKTLPFRGGMNLANS
jgi:hypothetical protein